MIWLLANWRVVAMAVLIAIPSSYAAVMKIRFEHERSSFTQYKAEIAAASAAAAVQNAQEAAQHEKNTREALDDLQTRFDALSARYGRVRQSATVRELPASPDTPVQACSCPAGESDATTRCLAVLEAGDREIAKYKELWDLSFKNATPR